MNVPDVTRIEVVETDGYTEISVDKVLTSAGTGDQRVRYVLRQGGNDVVIPQENLEKLLSVLSTAKETYVQGRLFDPDDY